MKKIALKFTYHTDIIAVPDNIAKEIKEYQNLFDKWIYDKSIDHCLWLIKNGEKWGVSFDTYTFVDYLNLYHIKDNKERAVVLEEDVIPPKGIKLLYF